MTSSLHGQAAAAARLVGRHRTIRGAEQTAQWLRHGQDYLMGRYRLGGRASSADVGDAVLADRIHSRLGPVHQQLDRPRIDVDVDHGFEVLRGHVSSVRQADDIIAAVRRSRASAMSTPTSTSVQHVGTNLHAAEQPPDVSSAR